MTTDETNQQSQDISEENEELILSDDGEESADTAPAEGSSQDEPEAKPGRVIKLQDLEQHFEYPVEEAAVLAQLYEKTITEFAESEIVKGKILSISDKEVAVDIGFKSEGVIPISEFKSAEELKVGDEIEIYLDKIEDSDGQLKLSKEKADFTKIWEDVVRKFESGDLIEGKIMRRIKGGMVVDLMGIDAFLPGSQIDLKPVRDFDSLIGKTLEFKIVKVNHLRKNIVISRRVIVEEGLSEQREKMMKDLEKGQVRWGVVKNITDFGVFIDLGGVDGLLHITDLSWGRIAHPSEIVSLDEKLQVVILDFDRERQRVSLGLKQLQPHPWENIEEKYPVRSKVSGKVVSITDYGAFIELEKGIEGLIHISEMSWTQHIKHPSKILSIGEEVETVVLNFDKDDKKISLGLKQIEPDPWTKVLTNYPLGSKHQGKVRNVTNFGVFVELEQGIDGLVHISDLSWTKKVRHPGDIVNKGEEIEVIILNVSVEDRRISLGHKQLEENPWDTFEVDFQKGFTTTGEIVRHVEKGLIVALPSGVEGFVPASHVEAEDDGEKKLRKRFNRGDNLTLKVIEFDKENKKIVLSQSEYLKDLEKQEVDEYNKKQKAQNDKVETVAEVETGEQQDTQTEEKIEPASAAETGSAKQTPEEIPLETEKTETTAEKASKPAKDKAVETESVATETNGSPAEVDSKAKPVTKSAAKKKKETKKTPKTKTKDSDK